MLVFGVVLLVVLYIAYLLLVKGWLFKLILFAAGWFGLYIGLNIYVVGSTNIALTFSGYSFSWAAVIPTIICIACLACTKDD
jgi:hypothetical protein